MRKWTARAARVALATAAITMIGAGAANADDTSGAYSILGGEQIHIPIIAPIGLFGNHVNLLSSVPMGGRMAYVPMDNGSDGTFSPYGQYLPAAMGEQVTICGNAISSANGVGTASCRGQAIAGAETAMPIAAPPVAPPMAPPAAPPAAAPQEAPAAPAAPAPDAATQGIGAPAAPIGAPGLPIAPVDAAPATPPETATTAACGCAPAAAPAAAPIQAPIQAPAQPPAAAPAQAPVQAPAAAPVQAPAAAPVQAPAAAPVQAPAAAPVQAPADAPAAAPAQAPVQAPADAPAAVPAAVPEIPAAAPAQPAEVSTSGQFGIISGNQAMAPVRTPIAICGNAGALGGVATASCDGTATSGKLAARLG